MRPKQIYTLEQYTDSGIISHSGDPLNSRLERADFLFDVRGLHHLTIIERAIQAKQNILVVGSTGSGKTTLVNAMLHSLARQCPDDRVLIIEDTAELQCSAKNVVALRATQYVTMLECLRAAMRLKPDRIIVGEVRGAEAHVLLKAWNTGHPGGMATIHADDAMGGLLRLESLVAEASSAPQQQLIAEAVRLVVFIGEESLIAARRKVKQLAFVTGYSDGRYQLEYL
jgi:type IV secretion system protein VirB11